MPLDAKDSAQLANFLQRIFFDPSEAENAAETDDKKNEERFYNAREMLNRLFYIYIGENNLLKKHEEEQVSERIKIRQQEITEMENNLEYKKQRIQKRIVAEENVKFPNTKKMQKQIAKEMNNDLQDLQSKKNAVGMVSDLSSGIADQNNAKIRKAVRDFITLTKKEKNKPADEQKNLDIITKIIRSKRGFNCLLNLFDDFAQCLGNREHFLQSHLEYLIKYIDYHAKVIKHSIFSVPELWRDWDYQGVLKILSALYKLRASLETILDNRSPTEDVLLSLFATVSNSALANDLKAEIRDEEAEAEIRDEEAKTASSDAEQTPLYLTEDDVEKFILNSPLSIGNMRDYNDPEGYSLFWDTIGFLSGRKLRLTHIPVPGKWTIKNLEAFWNDLENSIRVSEYLENRSINNALKYLENISKFAKRTDLSPREKAVRDALKKRLEKAVKEDVILIKNSYFEPDISNLSLLEICETVKSVAKDLGAKVPEHKEEGRSFLQKAKAMITKKYQVPAFTEDEAQGTSESQKKDETGQHGVGRKFRRKFQIFNNASKPKGDELKGAVSKGNLSGATCPTRRAEIDTEHDSPKDESRTDMNKALSQKLVEEDKEPQKKDKEPSKKVDIGKF